MLGGPNGGTGTVRGQSGGWVTGPQKFWPTLSLMLVYVGLFFVLHLSHSVFVSLGDKIDFFVERGANT